MSGGVSSEAVVFFDRGVVTKEMLYPEFEALLDHVVGVPEYQDREVNAVYLRINGKLKIRAAVFFKINFDERGFVDRSWNVPLPHLADSAGKGPDLGAGLIKLSCRSQCSVSWHQRALWDPEMESKPTTLDILCSAIARNRLGLDKEEEATVIEEKAGKRPVVASAVVDEKALREKLALQFQGELKQKASALAQEHKLRISAIKSEAQEYLERVHRSYREQMAELTESLATSKHLFAEEKKKNAHLKSVLDEQASALKSTREEWQQQLDDVRDDEQSKINELLARFELEKQAAINNAKTELKEMLDMREVELFYREEQLSNLRAEVGQLRQEKQNLLNESGDRLLQKLSSAGITYVAYHSGVDPVTVPVADVSRYLESPNAYVAEKCGVDTALYQQWLVHYGLPVCTHRDSGGMTCGQPIPKVSKPGRFLPGDSDRCAKHGQFRAKVASVIKMGEKT